MRASVGGRPGKRIRQTHQLTFSRWNRIMYVVVPCVDARFPVDFSIHTELYHVNHQIQ